MNAGSLGGWRSSVGALIAGWDESVCLAFSVSDYIRVSKSMRRGGV